MIPLWALLMAMAVIIISPMRTWFSAHMDAHTNIPMGMTMGETTMPEFQATHTHILTLLDAYTR